MVLLGEVVQANRRNRVMQNFNSFAGKRIVNGVEMDGSTRRIGEKIRLYFRKTLYFPLSLKDNIVLWNKSTDKKLKEVLLKSALVHRYITSQRDVTKEKWRGGRMLSGGQNSVLLWRCAFK